MLRKELIRELKNYFRIEEFVDQETFEKHGERSWKFFDYDLLMAALIIRVKLGKKITINNWIWGGKFDERGLRVNTSYIFKSKTIKGKLYLSGHVLGKAIDFDVEGMTAEEVRIWIKENADLFPFKIRLEWKISKTGKVITWVHLDIISEEKNPKVYLFNV